MSFRINSKIVVNFLIALFVISTGFLLLPKMAQAVATLSYIFDSRGLYNDLKYSKFTGGGITNAWYRNGAATDLFDDSPAVDDSIYVYMCAPFNGWEVVNISSPMASTAHVLAYEYWNGSAWTAVSGLTDGTNALTQNGQITWTKPTDWETVSASTGAGSKSGAYAIFALRIRLVSFTDITEGGYLTGYQNVRQKYINISDGGSHTPASLYADDVAGSWGVITKKGDYAYDISCGVSFGSGTFTFNNTKIKIGEAGSANYVPFQVSGCIMLCNDSATYMSDDLASALIVYSKGSYGTISFRPNKASKLYNLYLAQPYDSHYSRFATYTSGGSGQAQWYNVLIGSMMYTGGSHYFNRINFQNIQYLLSAGDTVYDNCIFGTKFNKDPGYAPVVLKPTFDGGGSSASDWIGYYYPDSNTRQHHFDVISGTWPHNNKWKCYCDDAYPDSTKRSHVMIYSNYLNIKVQDKDGDPINGVKLSIKDQYDNSALWEDLEVYLTGTPSDTLDTSWVVNDASDLNVNDELLYWGEIVKITNIAGNTLTVERGLESSARVYNLNDYYVPLRRRVATMTIDGSKDEIYIPERIYYRYSIDGGITSTGNLYRDYNPFTVRIDHQDYPSREFELTIDEATDLTLALKDKPMSEGTAKVLGTEYESSDDTAAIYAQILHGDGSPATSSDVTLTVYDRDGNVVSGLNATSMTYIANGIYRFSFTTPVTEGTYVASVTSTDPTAYGVGDFHIASWANRIAASSTIADAVWDEQRSEHATSGSFGESLQNIVPTVLEIASSTWGYTGDALDIAGNAISKVWSYTGVALDTANNAISKVWTYTGSSLDTAGNAISKVWDYTTRKLTSRQIATSTEYIAGVTSSSAVAQVANEADQETVRYNVELVRKATFDFAGFADAGCSTSTLVDSELSEYPDNHWQHYTLIVMDGVNAGERIAIASSTGSTLYFREPGLAAVTGEGDKYVLSHEDKLVHKIWNWTGEIVSGVWNYTNVTSRRLSSLFIGETATELATKSYIDQATSTIIAEIDANEALLNDLDSDLSDLSATTTLILNKWDTYSAADIIGYVDDIETYIGTSTDATSTATLFGKANLIKEKWGTQTAQAIFDKASSTLDAVNAVQTELGYNGTSTTAYADLQLVKGYTDDLEGYVGTSTDATSTATLFGEINKNKELVEAVPGDVWEESRASHVTPGTFGAALQNIVSSAADIASSTWAYTASALDTTGNAIAKVWDYATRGLTTRQIATSTEYIAGVTSSAPVGQVASQAQLDQATSTIIAEINANEAILSDLSATATAISASTTAILAKWGTHDADELISDLDILKLRIGTSTDASTTGTLFGRVNLIQEKWGTQTSQTIFDKASSTLDKITEVQTELGYNGTSTTAYADMQLVKGYTDDLEGYVGTPLDTSTSTTLFGKIKDTREKLDQLDTLETKLDTIDSIIDSIRASQQLNYTVELSDIGEVLQGTTTRAKLTILDYESVPTNALSIPTIILYDASRAIATSGSMTLLSTGVYEHTYVVPSDATSGLWESIVSVDLGGATALTLNDYWEVEGSPAQVIINSISDTTVPSISANVTISNEGNSGYEYQYEWCVVTSQDNQCGGGDDIDYASAAKFLAAGEDYTANLSATVPNTGNYWFKVVVYYGTEASGASRVFTATEEGEEEGTTGGGGGTASFNHSQIYNKLLEVQNELGYHDTSRTAYKDLSNTRYSLGALPDQLSKPFYTVLTGISSDIQAVGGTKAYSLNDIYDISKANTADLSYIINKSADLKAVIEINKSLISGVANQPIIQTWFTEGSVILNILVVNPPDTARTVEVKEYLPKEIRAEDIIKIDEELQLEYDSGLDSYFVRGEVKLGAGQRKTFKVEVEDVFKISEDELTALKEQAETLMEPLKGTSYFAQASILKSEIDANLKSISREQVEGPSNIEKKISAYRNNQKDLEKVKENIKALKSIVSEVSGKGGVTGSLFGVSATMTWAIIIIVVVGIAVLMILLWVILMKSRALEYHISGGKKLKTPPIVNVKKQAVKIKGGLITYFLPPFGKPIVDLKQLIKLIEILIVIGILVALVLLGMRFIKF